MGFLLSRGRRRCCQVAVLPIGSLRVCGSNRKPENECRQEAVQPGQLHDFGTPMLANLDPGRKVRSWPTVDEACATRGSL